MKKEFKSITPQANTSRFYLLIIFFAFFLVSNIKAQYTKLYDFRADDNNNISQPYYTQFATDGSVLYGMTNLGGNYNLGTIFKMNPDGSGLQKLLDFDGKSKGALPCGSLTLSGDSLYGMTVNGGVNDMGVIFKIGINGSGFQKLLDFNITNGANPYGSLTLSGNSLYGMTHSGGANGYGLLFKLNINDKGYSKILDFDGNNGASPYGSLILSNDTLYGMTYAGGSYNYGVIFKIKTDGSSFAQLFAFDNGYYGGHPEGSLALLNNRLYGMTSTGGSTYGFGIIFKIPTSGLGFPTRIVEFSGTGASGTGALPRSSLTFAGDSLCGLTSKGGLNNKGVIFKLDIKGLKFRKLLDFDATNNGANPCGSLTFVGSVLYGMTNSGGANDRGVLFKINSNGSSFTKLKNCFSAAQGANPNDLISDGASLYGMSQFGGANGKGVLYKINPDGTGYQDLVDFDGTSKGSQPQGSLILSGSMLYGMTSLGGANNLGVIFKININGTGFQKLYDFSLSTYANPQGALTFYNDSLYGMCREGGTNGYGGIFRININNTGFKKLHDFDRISDGSYPYGSFVLLGKTLYGMNSDGGANGYGVIFKINTSGYGFQNLYDLSSADGVSPYGSLVLVRDSLYGMTSQGGNNNKGNIFKIGTNGTGFKKLFDFDGANGANPHGSLMVQGDTLYGMTGKGGANDYGSIFRLNIKTNAFKKLLDLDFTIGAYPQGSFTLLNESAYVAIKQGGIDGLGTLIKYRVNGFSQATNIQFTNVLATQMNIGFTKGDGENRAVFVYQGSTGIPTLTTGSIYTANTTFGQGSLAGAGWYCVANGNLTGTAITVTNLLPNTTYRVMVAEYAGLNGGELYSNITATGNPANQNTVMGTQTITFNPLTAKKYGDANFNPGATASSGLPVSYSSSNTNVATIIGNNVYIVGAGTANITASQSGNSSYYVAPNVTQPLLVSKATITATANNMTRKVGEANPVFTISYSGWIGLDNENVLTSRPTITCLATTASPIGDYDITLSDGSDNSYTFTYVSGKLTVVPGLGIGEADQDGIKIYPIPASSRLNIKLPGAKVAVIQIMSLTGQVVLTTQFNSQFETIDVSNLVKGFYVIKIIVNNKVELKKIEIQ